MLLILTAAWNSSNFFLSVFEPGVSGDGREARRWRIVLFSESYRPCGIICVSSSTAGLCMSSRNHATYPTELVVIVPSIE